MSPEEPAEMVERLAREIAAAGIASYETALEALGIETGQSKGDVEPATAPKPLTEAALARWGA